MHSFYTVRNPKALLLPELQGLLRRAVEATPDAAPFGWDSIAESLLGYVTSPNAAMLVGVEELLMRALVLVNYPLSALFPYPTVSLIYNEGSVGLRKAMAKHVFATISSVGYRRVWVMNRTGHPANVFARLTPPGTKSTLLGDLIEVEILEP